MSERSPSRVRWLSLALLLVLAAPVLSGCITARDTQLPVKTACRADALPTDIVPAPTPNAGTTTPPQRGEQVRGGTPVKIGLLAPSADHPDAEAFRRGAELAIVQIQTAGVDATLHVEEPGGDAASAAAAFDELTRVQGVSVVVSALDAETTGALLPMAKQNRVALLAAGADEASLSAGQSNDVYFWRVLPTRALEGKALTELLLQSGCRTAVVVNEDTSHGNEVATAFLEAVHARGGAARDRIRFPPDALDTGAVLDRIAQFDAQAVVLIAHPDDAASLMAAAYKHTPSEGSGPKGRHLLSQKVFFFPGTLKDPTFVQKAGSTTDDSPLLAGLRGTAATRVDTDARPVFEQSYSLRYNGLPPVPAAAAYDAAWIAALAIQCAQTDQGEGVALKIQGIANADPGDADVSGEDPAAALTVARNCNANHVGALHDYDLDPYGDPVTGPFQFWIVADDGALRPIRTLYEP